MNHILGLLMINWAGRGEANKYEKLCEEQTTFALNQNQKKLEVFNFDRTKGLADLEVIYDHLNISKAVSQNGNLVRFDQPTDCLRFGCSFESILKADGELKRIQEEKDKIIFEEQIFKNESGIFCILDLKTYDRLTCNKIFKAWGFEVYHLERLANEWREPESVKLLAATQQNSKLVLETADVNVLKSSICVCRKYDDFSDLLQNIKTDLNKLLRIFVQLSKVVFAESLRKLEKMINSQCAGWPIFKHKKCLPTLDKLEIGNRGCAELYQDLRHDLCQKLLPNGGNREKRWGLDIGLGSSAVEAENHNFIERVAKAQTRLVQEVNSQQVRNKVYKKDFLLVSKQFEAVKKEILENDDTVDKLISRLVQLEHRFHVNNLRSDHFNHLTNLQKGIRLGIDYFINILTTLYNSHSNMQLFENDTKSFLYLWLDEPEFKEETKIFCLPSKHGLINIKTIRGDQVENYNGETETTNSFENCKKGGVCEYIDIPQDFVMAVQDKGSLKVYTNQQIVCLLNDEVPVTVQKGLHTMELNNVKSIRCNDFTRTFPRNFEANSKVLENIVHLSHETYENVIKKQESLEKHTVSGTKFFGIEEEGKHYYGVDTTAVTTSHISTTGAILFLLTCATAVCCIKRCCCPYIQWWDLCNGKACNKTNRKNYRVHYKAMQDAYNSGKNYADAASVVIQDSDVERIYNDIKTRLQPEWQAKLDTLSREKTAELETQRELQAKQHPVMIGKMIKEHVDRLDQCSQSLDKRLDQLWTKVEDLEATVRPVASQLSNLLKPSTLPGAKQGGKP